MLYKGKNILIKDHPLAIIVQGQWDKWLDKFEYPRDINVCALPTYVLHFIYAEIDRVVENWFRPDMDIDERRNLLNAWNYKARHLPQDIRKAFGYYD